LGRVEHNAVATGFFGSVERLIGSAQQVFHVCGMLWENGDPDGHSDADCGCCMRDIHLFNGGAPFFGAFQG